MRFRESLPKLVEVAKAFGVVFDKATVIIRDSSGRLMISREELASPEALSHRVKNELGSYAAPKPVITGSLAKRIATDPAIVSFLVAEPPGSTTINYIDRRIVGVDWLAGPTEKPNGPPRVVFSSLKGGVGRSTALAILAADLANEGKRVLAIDLDLEAPGIGFMFLSEDSDGDRRPKYGVIDYLVENGICGVDDAELYDFVGVCPFSKGSIDVIPAVGRDSDNSPESVIAMLSRALTDDASPQGPISVGRQIRAMVDRFASRAEYDIVLIDARAGMAEISAAPLLSLGAEVLLFGIDQPQTYKGYAYILAHLLANAHPDFASDKADWRSSITFVQAKAPAASSKRAGFREKIYELCTSYLYDAESLDADGKVIEAGFNPGPSETGTGIPHDVLHIQNQAEFGAFDPLSDQTQLDSEVYGGPFGAFLTRVKAMVFGS
jgi:Mrp family chromosome partitioning ATPase